MAFAGIAMTAAVFFMILAILIITALVGLVCFIIGLVMYLYNRKTWKQRQALGQRPGWTKPFSVTFLTIGATLWIILAALLLWAFSPR